MHHVQRTVVLVWLLVGIALLIGGLRTGTTGVWVVGLGVFVLGLFAVGWLVRRQVTG